MQIDTEFDLGELVFLKIAVEHAPEEVVPGEVVGFKVIPPGVVVYEVDWSDGESAYYHSFQLTTVRYAPNGGDGE